MTTRITGLVRLVHPFPSVLDGAIVAVVALVAGASPLLAAVLGLSMTLLQFSIGALNDVVDEPRDVGRRPGKPIPAGLVGRRAGIWIAAGCAAGGLALALACGPAVVALALLGLAIGAAYDLVAKGTTLSWLPLAAGVPLLPVYGWLGATGSLPGVFLVLVPAAANAGTALAISNAIVDVERDADAGTGSIALALGPRRAAVIVIALHVVVVALALGTAAVLRSPEGWLVALLAVSAVPIGGALLGYRAAGRPGTGLRQLAWEIQAVGIGLLAVAWLTALSASGGGAAGG